MNRYLVCYDYGTGGLWGVVIADSAESIILLYPEVVAFESGPEWMTQAERERIWSEDPLHLEGPPEGLFRTVIADRPKTSSPLGQPRRARTLNGPQRQQLRRRHR